MCDSDKLKSVGSSLEYEIPKRIRHVLLVGFLDPLQKCVTDAILDDLAGVAAA